MYFRALSIIFSCLILISCKEEIKNELWEMESLEVYRAVVEGNEAVEGELGYKEAKIYDERGIQKQLWLYNKGGDLSAVEDFVFEANSKKPLKSNFYDYKDSLLSYYTFEYDKAGKKIRSEAFDAGTDELLRIEKFYYDEKGNQNKKEICNAFGAVQRTHEFNHDDFGNESLFKMKGIDGSVKYLETYTITETDEQNRWTEMWSFQDKKPVNIKRRTFRKFTPEKRDQE